MYVLSDQMTLHLLSIQHWLSLKLKLWWLGATTLQSCKWLNREENERVKKRRNKVTTVCYWHQTQVLRQTLSVNSQQTHLSQPGTTPSRLNTHETFFSSKSTCHLLLSNETASNIIYRRKSQITFQMDKRRITKLQTAYTWILMRENREKLNPYQV